MTELTFLKELMLIGQGNQKSAIFVTNVFFFRWRFNFQPHVWNKCHDLLMMTMNLSDIAILNIKMLIISVLLRELAKFRS